MIPVAFIINGEIGSAMGHRARAFAERLQGRYDLRLFYRSGHKGAALVRLFSELIRFQPEVCYLYDIAYSGIGAAGLYKHVTRGRLVVETGDAIAELARSLGRGALGAKLTHWLERYALSVADRVVVRGTYHQEWLARSGIGADVIQDGVETELFASAAPTCLRREFGLEEVLTVGLIGSSVWSPRLQMCYGWDMIELIRRLRDERIMGVLIGGGSGIPVLQKRCRQYGIEGRVLFLGPLPYAQLPGYLGLIDVCLSTQTNDLVGRVRTTGKLPLYLASGRYVLASRVGEAARVLGDDMLVEYEGVVDKRYPQRLAERVLPLLRDRTLLDRGRANAALARSRFDYDVLAKKVGEVIDTVARRPKASSRFGKDRLASRLTPLHA